jgi:hypothetical protein
MKFPLTALSLFAAIQVNAQNLNIGTNAGQNNQGNGNTAIGSYAGQNSQNSGATAVGSSAGQNNQGFESTALGGLAGQYSQGGNATAIGCVAGQFAQGNAATAIGSFSGYTNQGGNATAVGSYAGEFMQGNAAAALGWFAGYTNQGFGAVAVGEGAGAYNQSNEAVAIGGSAGSTSQGSGAVAVGVGAGAYNQGYKSIAIGCFAGFSNQPAESIIINATDKLINGSNSGFYVDPIRFNSSIYAVYYNPTTAEVTYAPAPQNGTNGATGPAGPAGPQGPAGKNGTNGPQGLTGATGPQGPVGPQGQKGVFDPTVLTNTAFLTGLASNPVFLNALSAQIRNGTNNFGFAVKQNQTLTFPAIATVTYATNAPKITLSATSSSGLTNVTFTSANGSVATIVSNSMTIKGAGSTTITASQAGNALWNPVSASQTFVVRPITQTISFPAIPIQARASGQKVTLNANSSAKLPITYIVANTAIAEIPQIFVVSYTVIPPVTYTDSNGYSIYVPGTNYMTTNVGSTNVLTILGSGTTTVTATNEGSQNYTPAGATQTLIVK